MCAGDKDLEGRETDTETESGDREPESEDSPEVALWRALGAYVRHRIRPLGSEDTGSDSDLAIAAAAALADDTMMAEPTGDIEQLTEDMPCLEVRCSCESA